jgi:hypothetical protein
MHELVCYDVSGIIQIGTLMTALFGVGIVLGILGFTWGALNDIFGGIPFIGRIFRRE